MIPLLAWLPLLAFVSGRTAIGRQRGRTLPVGHRGHVRFLVVLPLFIIAELVVHQRMRFVVRQFLERNLIPRRALPRFEDAIASAFRLRNSVLAEVLLIAFVYGIGVLIIWRHYMALSTATWYAVPTAEGLKLSVSGRLVWLREPADLPVFAAAMVLPDVYLESFSLPGVAHRLEHRPHPSGPRRRPGISGQHGLRLYAAGAGAWCDASGTDSQPYFLSRGRAD